MSNSADPAPSPNSLAARMGQANAFNTIRLLAAIAVIFSHGYELTGYEEPLELLTGQSTIGQLAVAAFFVISGFLISTSFDRSRFVSFVEKRARRIMPGLIVAVLITVFLVGPLASTLGVGEYFRRAGTWIYLAQAVLLPVTQDLPGVFTSLPNSAVNGSLWSLRFEVACYAILCVLLSVRRLRLPFLLTAWLASFYFAGSFTARPPAGTMGADYYIVMFASLFRFFGAGMLLYNLARWVPINRIGLAFSAVLTVFSAASPHFNAGLAIFGSYALLSFGYLAPKWFADITKRGDVSYGVYIYAFPIQQIFVKPSIALAALAQVNPPLVNALISLPVIGAAGLLSWMLVEKPMIHFGRRRAGKYMGRPAAIGGGTEAA